MSKATLTPAVQSTIDALLPTLLPGSEQEYNDTYLSANSVSARRILGASHGLLQLSLSRSSSDTLSAEERAPILALLASLSDVSVGSTSTDLSHALELAQLPSVGATDAEVEELRGTYVGKLPAAWDLRGKGEKEERVRGLEAEKEGEGEGKNGKGEKSDV